MSAAAGEPVTVRVNPILCDGVGMCVHLSPDLLSMDPWGFPIVPAGPLTEGQVGQAERAAAGCPRRALLLTRPS